jgi:hypothetical protein
VEFRVNQKVLLLTKNICSWRPSKKLNTHYAGPFVVSKVISSQAYQLHLPKSYGNTHPTFHVSLLKEWNPRDTETVRHMEPIIINREEEWEVEDIITE